MFGCLSTDFISQISIMIRYKIVMYVKNKHNFILRFPIVEFYLLDMQLNSAIVSNAPNFSIDFPDFPLFLIKKGGSISQVTY